MHPFTHKTCALLSAALCYISACQIVEMNPAIDSSKYPLRKGKWAAPRVFPTGKSISFDYSQSRRVTEKGKDKGCYLDTASKAYFLPELQQSKEINGLGGCVENKYGARIDYGAQYKVGSRKGLASLMVTGVTSIPIEGGSHVHSAFVSSYILIFDTPTGGEVMTQGYWGNAHWGPVRGIRFRIK